MGNSRSKAKATAAAGGGGVTAAVSLDDSGSSKNNGKKSLSSSKRKSSRSSGNNSRSSKKQGKTKKENGKNGKKKEEWNNSHQHHMITLARQDSYNKAILQHQQQEALVLHGATAAVAIAVAAAMDEEIIPPHSMHARLVRSRDGEQQPVHQIYDIINEIGHGGLCKVFCIQKKQEYIGGSSRPQNVRNRSIGSTCTINSNGAAANAANNKQNKWLMKTLQSLGTITIRARAPPPGNKKPADEANDEEEGDGGSDSDPWNLPELRFLFCHHHGDSSNATSAKNDDSASSDKQQQQQQQQQRQQQQQQQQPTTASPPKADDVAKAATTASTTPSLSLSTSTTVGVSSRAGNAAIPSVNKPMYFALKVINLVMVQDDKIAQLKNEVEILKTLDHPNIIKAYETFNTKRQVMMIMELCTGGDLRARMPYTDTDTELQVADVMRHILSAIRYIHVRHIVHRDIKMENIMFESTHPQAAIKIIDFGLSKNYSTNSHHILTERVGTLYSMSPETLRGIAYTTQADLWSIGVVAFILLANGRAQPFEGNNPKQVVANVLRGRFSFDNEEIWGHISQHAKDFISSLLVLEPEQRLTASTAREHEWFTYCKKLECLRLDQSAALATLDVAAGTIGGVMTSTTTSSDTQSDHASTAIVAAAFLDNDSNNEDSGSITNASSINQYAGGDDAETSFKSVDTDTSKLEEFKNRVREALVEYAEMGEFRKLTLNVIAKKSSSSEIFELRKVFKEFDYLGTGTITLEEFSTALSRFQYSPHDIHTMFTKIDINRDNAINYSEFLAAALETQGAIEEYRLAEAFDILDVDDSGFISHENLRKILPPSKYSDAYIDQLIAEGDFKGDGVISYEQFLQVFAKKKHDRVEAIYCSNHADGERKSVTAAQGGVYDNDDDDESSKDSSQSTDDVLRRYGILQTLRRGFGSSERLENKARSRLLSSDDTKKNNNVSKTKNAAT